MRTGARSSRATNAGIMSKRIRATAYRSKAAMEVRIRYRNEFAKIIMAARVG